jgi:hypothetical protein
MQLLRGSTSTDEQRISSKALAAEAASRLPCLRLNVSFKKSSSIYETKI